MLRDGCFAGLDLVIVDVDDPLALEWAPKAAAQGAQVIDNSAAFRMDPDVPLVVAEVNPDDMRTLPKGIASCPNCTTMIPVTALAPLHRAARIDRMVVSTYQSVSGAGQVGMHELDAQWTKLGGRSEELRARGRARRAARRGGGVVEADCRQRHPARGVDEGSGLHVGGVEDDPRDAQDPPRRRDPVHGHVRARAGVRRPRGQRANVRFHRPMSKAEAVELLRDAPGVRLVDDGDGFPTPLDAAGIDPVLVGRVREDPSEPGTLNLWITGDNLRKGAALNAVQLAELLCARPAASLDPLRGGNDASGYGDGSSSYAGTSLSARSGAHSRSHRTAVMPPMPATSSVGRRPIVPPSTPPASEPNGIVPHTMNRIDAFMRPWSRWGVIACRRLTWLML